MKQTGEAASDSLLLNVGPRSMVARRNSWRGPLPVGLTRRASLTHAPGPWPGRIFTYLLGPRSQLPRRPACREEAAAPSSPAAPANPRRRKPLRTCGHCGCQQRGMQHCSCCQAAWFCGADCQRAAWPVRAAVCALQRGCMRLSNAVQGGLWMRGAARHNTSKLTCCCCRCRRSTSRRARRKGAGRGIE